MKMTQREQADVLSQSWQWQESLSLLRKCVRDSKAGRGVGRLDSKKGKASGVHLLEAVGMGELKVN